jgi:chromosome partitioning protein
MHVIAVVSQKGGSGKTTLSGHLSVQAELSGHGPVAVIDTDPQGSLAAWWNERESPVPVFVQTTLHELRGHLENMRQAGVSTVVIDTPPAITGAIHEVISIADYVVVPTKPSPHDLRAVGATVKLVQACNKPMVFVLNDANPRAKITFEAAIALSQHGTVAPVTVHHRTLFASSMIDGRTAMELEPNGQSALEIAGLWEYVNARLNFQVVPTAIGLDAFNRRDGQGGTKQPFALSSSDPSVTDLQAIPHAVTQTMGGDTFEDEESPEIPVDGPEPPAPSLVQVKTVERVPDPVAREFSEPQPAPNLWDGFVQTYSPRSVPRPEPQVENASVSPRVARVFGRRHFGA